MLRRHGIGGLVFMDYLWLFGDRIKSSGCRSCCFVVIFFFNLNRIKRFLLAITEATVDALHVDENTLPVGSFHLYHILDIE